MAIESLLKTALIVALLLAGSAALTSCAHGMLRKSRYAGPNAPDKPFTEDDVAIDGVRLHLQRGGEGDPPVVFVHGFGGSAFSWRFLWPVFSKHHRVMALDLPGHGYAERPHEFDYSAIHIGRMLVTLLEKEGLKNVILIGNSYGGAVSVAAILDAMEKQGADQDLISKLVLIDSAGYPQKLPGHVAIMVVPGLNRLLPAMIPPKLMIRTIVRSMYGEKKRVTKDQIREYTNVYSVPGTRRSYRGYVRDMRPENIGEYIAKYKTIKVPTLVITGDKDKVVPPAIAERFHRDIEGSKLVVVKGSGHIPQEEDPDAVLAALAEFLGEDLAR